MRLETYNYQEIWESWKENVKNGVHRFSSALGLNYKDDAHTFWEEIVNIIEVMGLIKKLKEGRILMCKEVTYYNPQKHYCKEYHY